MAIPTIGKYKESDIGLIIDVPRLIETRCLIQANSGAGKSWLLRRLLEQTHGLVQQIVIDIEGEFSTLREKFDYVVAGKGGDIPLNIKVAPILARRLLELRTSAILDLYELKHHERILFVKRFLEALINLPKELWHPCLVVIDEAHIFAPEKSKAESLPSVIDLCTRGRKRGLCGVLATQRISKLHKDTAAELLNKFVGRTGLDIDMKRAADELGFTTKSQLLSLRDLEPGDFYGFGPALTKSVARVRVGSVVTTHPKVGSRQIVAPPPATAKVKMALQGLIDLSMEADEELRTVEDFKRKINELKVELRKKPKPGIDDGLLKRSVERARKGGFEEATKAMTKQLSGLRLAETKYRGILAKIHSLSVISDESPKAGTGNVPLPMFKPKSIPLFQSEKPKKVPTTILEGFSDSRPLRAGAMKMLKGVAMFHPRRVSRQQLATVTGFSARGGTFNTYLSELKRNGWVVEEGKELFATEEGISNAGHVDPLPSDPEEIINLWAGKFRQGAAKMLRVIAERYPEPIEKDELGETTGFTVSGGTFNTYLSELRRNGLIVVEGTTVKATKELFLED